MPERVQVILNRIVEWWKKFTTKQKVLLCSITAVILLSLGILAAVVNQPKMVTLITCEDTKQSGQVKSLLDGEQIKYELSDDGLVFKVNKKDEAAASILLGSNEIPTSGFGIDDATGGSFTTTAADKQKKYVYYLENKFEEHLEFLDTVDDAEVDITLPNEDGTILAREEQSTAAVSLRLNGEMDEDQALALAQYIATELGNKNTEGITIITSDNRLLFSGLSVNSAEGVASSQLSRQQKMENMVRSEVKNVMLQSGLFSNVAVGLSLDVDFSSTESAQHNYSPPEGQTNGMITQQSTYDSSAIGGLAAEPGAGANDDTPTYVTEDNTYSESSISETKTTYQPNEEIIKTISQGGSIKYDESSISLVGTRNVVYDEDLMKEQGLLEDMTFDEFIAENSEPVPIEIDDGLYQLVANATGFPIESITILGYEQPQFIHSSGSGRTFSDILQIVLTVLIFALLGYVVFRSTRKQKEAEEEPELSVESLLESTSEAQENLEDIGYNEKSDIRVMIEKFVDENPDAAALLLRNWLNEEWG